MENVRFNISPCTPQEAAAFVNKIDTAAYTPRGEKKASERSHYDTYSFLSGESRVAVVYDTFAHVISITAPTKQADELLSLFAPDSQKTVKRSTVPAQSGARQDAAADKPAAERQSTRSRLFVSPDAMRAQHGGQTIIATAKGAEITTDEIYPPQRAYPKRSARPETSAEPAAQSDGKKSIYSYGSDRMAAGEQAQKRSTLRESGYISANSTRTDASARRATISFADDEEVKTRADSAPRTTGTGLYADISSASVQPDRRERDRSGGNTETVQPKPEYQNGYSVKNYPPEALNGVLKRLRSFEKYRVTTDAVEFAGTPQEVKNYTVTDDRGQKVILRYATNKQTVQLQGKRSELFGELQSQVSRDSDYSSALEGYVETMPGHPSGKSKVSEVQNRLRRRLPTAFDFLSEQSRIDFSYGIHDFGQNNLRLSDYSVLLVPAFRGLERFVFDLQRAEGINVKMIGQAFDKDASGRYILKTGYSQRIGSVIYCEVMVALYTEYFSRRNFFAHSDNTDENISRSITDRAVAKKIFDDLLDVVEYNAKKLKEIGFFITQK